MSGTRGRSVGNPSTSADRFRLVPFDRIRLSTAPRFLVKGLLPIIGLAVFWGPPKCGKSFLVFDLLMHVALGWLYQGRRVQAGPVVYCALEGQAGFEARAEAFKQRHLDSNTAPVPFYLMPTPLNLVADNPGLISAIRMQMPEGERPAVVCLDTLNRSFVGSESDDEAMTAYVKAADVLRDAFGCLVVVVHHSGVDASRPRGHTSLIGALDAQIAVKKDSDGRISAVVERMKDGPEGEAWTVRLEPVEVGKDDDGDPISSCVVVEEAGATKPSAGPGRRMNDRQRLAIGALNEAIINFGKPAPASFNLPSKPLAVPAERWREELHARGVIEADDRNPRASFKRLREGLAARSLIGERDGLIWSVTGL